MKRNRWLIALSAMGLHLCIGSVYAWSVLTKPIMESMGFTLKETTWTFSLAILFLGLSAGFLGSFVQKIGPRKSGLLSMTCFVTAMFGTAAALYAHSLPMLYAFYGVIGGIGLGTGYITPVSTLVKWFPENRGFATGLAIMGFGFASLIAGPAMQLLVQHFGLVANFIILGWEAMKTWQFGALWWIFFVNITCGIGLLAVASPLAQEAAGMDAAQAASMVGIIGLLNGAGRIFWSSISDFLGRAVTYALFFVIELVAFGLLAGTGEPVMFQALVFLIITCYGGGFSCMPAYLSDLFGTRQLSAIHGRILTAWGAAGVAGPLVLSLIKENTNSYAVTLYFFVGAFVAALALMIFLKYRTRHGIARVAEARG